SRALNEIRLQPRIAEAADVNAEREFRFLGNRPKAIIVSGRFIRAVGKGRYEGALMTVLERPLELRNGVSDAAGRNDRLRNQSTVGRGAEVAQPLIVGAHAGDLELSIFRVRACAGQRDAGIQKLCV